MFRSFNFTAPAIIGIGLGLVACGPHYARLDAPAHACPQITATDYEAAISAGAASATARVKGSFVSIETGPGIVQCATFRGGAMKPCRRPNDFVIRYEVDGGQTFHVRVPAGEQYRFNVQRAPNTCEILESPTP